MIKFFNKNKPLFNTKFDLIVSIGEDCACTSYLRRFKLQDYSYPFDWLTKASFPTRFELLINNFSDFLQKENLYKFERTVEGSETNPCDSWGDKKYDFYFYHDFHKNLPFDEEYEKVKDKYERRINRLYKQLELSEKILFVWWSRNNPQDTDIVINNYKLLREKFKNKEVFLLLIEYSQNRETLSFENEHIIISRFDNLSYEHNPNWTRVLGNEDNNSEIFSQIKIKRGFKWYIKLFIFKVLMFCINVIPSKNARKTYRQKLQQKFYKAKL